MNVPNIKTDVFYIFVGHMKIKYQQIMLDNGLRVLVHEDHSIPIAAVNILYNVGSRDESPEKTGFAHLFEHLMFGGSRHIPSYDQPLQRVGGENNAFTSPDLTNYYLTVPSNNLETAFWLESDRMLGLSFEDKVLDVQRKVVIEEFKQRYLNQPYGDVWLLLRPLAYQVHPYQWPTIGRDISHIENTTMEDVRHFFNTFYIPNNAILVVAGDVDPGEVFRLSEKWFGPIPAGTPYERNLPEEPAQKEKRTLEAVRDVPSDAIYMVCHMPGRRSEDFHAADLLSDILGRGKSSRLYRRLVRKEKVFQSIHAHVTGSLDPGLLIISGKLREGYRPEEGERRIWESLEEIKAGNVQEEELKRAREQAETSMAFLEVEMANRAMNLAYFTNLGDPELYNQEIEKVRKVGLQDISRVSGDILAVNNASVLHYRASDNELHVASTSCH